MLIDEAKFLLHVTLLHPSIYYIVSRWGREGS